jgi:alkyl hydroperoxide reductase subunit AhpF
VSHRALDELHADAVLQKKLNSLPNVTVIKGAQTALRPLRGIHSVFEFMRASSRSWMTVRHLLLSPP